MIIAFTKDWDDVPTCTTHILREMAKTVPVLWVSSIGTRKPSAASGKDLRRIAGRVLSGLRRAEWKENKLSVLNPILIPKAESSLAKWINRVVFGWYVRREVREVGSGETRALLEFEQRGSKDSEGHELAVLPNTEPPQSYAFGKREGRGSIEYWCFVPNAVDLIPKAGAEGGKLKAEGGGGRKPNTQNMTPVPTTSNASRIIYYCADDWGKFHNLDGAWMDAKERELVDRADAVFVTSRFLEDKLNKIGFEQEEEEDRGLGAEDTTSHTSLSTPHSLQSTIHYMPHGVEYDRFSRALDKTLPVPDDVAGLSKPVIGFYGNLHPWVDFEVMAAVAVARPDWSFVLIGERYADVAALEVLSNVHLLGRREHGCLHDYCRAFDVAIIPYDMKNARMESVNPVKTKELLAAGLPVVASDVPELRNYGDDVLTCTGTDAWLDALERQVAREDHAAISERVREASWENKVAEIRRIVEGE